MANKLPIPAVAALNFVLVDTTLMLFWPHSPTKCPIFRKYFVKVSGLAEITVVILLPASRKSNKIDCRRMLADYTPFLHDCSDFVQSSAYVSTSIRDRRVTAITYTYM